MQTTKTEDNDDDANDRETNIDLMRLVLQKNAARSGRSSRKLNDEVDWDESGGFSVTPNCVVLGQGRDFDWHLVTKRRFRSSSRTRCAAPGGDVAAARPLDKITPSSGFGLFGRNQPYKPPHQPQQLLQPQRKTKQASHEQQQQLLRHSKNCNKQPNSRQRSSTRRKKNIEQIPEEMRVRIVYGGDAGSDDAKAGARSGNGGGTAVATGMVGQTSSSTTYIGDAATVTTCTTAGRSSLRTAELDELTKRAMAQVILRQLLDKDAIVNIRKPDPEATTTSILQAESADVEESQTNGLDFLWSCCDCRCSLSTEAPSSRTTAPPTATVPDEPTLATPMTNVTDSRTVFTGSSTGGGSSYTEGSSSWRTDSIESSLSSTEGWW